MYAVSFSRSLVSDAFASSVSSCQRFHESISHHRRQLDPKPFSRKVWAHGRVLYSFNSICVHLSSFSCRVLIPLRISIFSFKTELNVGQRRVKDKKREVLKYMSEEGFRITGSLRRSGPALAHTFSFSRKVQALTFLLNLLRHKS